ncbi:FadR/GntR family transcriptional regulator [Aureimonas sp. ME7]|uniref:FadR/GntR family transcriptional regulator n=1 Tax=Aureimonas sp. ME7 TaxID=2744252 RepID=UPI0015F8B1AD|nr:FadR/GntR family transcriptional regulator [Aureimonas sp. ME7]
MTNLTNRTSAALRAKILDGTFVIGDKLPTLAVLAAEFGVSRTVIREAVAALQSDGLLQSRHGVGVFVLSADAEVPPSQASLTSFEGLAQSPIALMDLLELRMAFEVHAAGLAATRRSWGQESRIWDAERAFEEALDREEALDSLDFDFHRSIAEATNNQAFREFFEIMGPRMLPQPAFSRDLNPTLINEPYIRQTVAEHRAICEAIAAADPDGAREAMKRHLTRSHHRYRGFSNTGGSPLSHIAQHE